MPRETIDLNPTSHLTAGMLGEEDDRRFELHGHRCVRNN